MIDHVPELIQTKSESSAGTAATAEPVSWQAGAITGTPVAPTSAATSGSRLPSSVPGGTTSGKMPVGMPMASSSGCDQVFVTGS